MKGKTIFVNSKNHAYLIPVNFPPNEIAINPKTKVDLNGEIVCVKYDDYTIGELMHMLESGEADDIT